jgi:hypothetical protein
VDHLGVVMGVLVWLNIGPLVVSLLVPDVSLLVESTAAPDFRGFAVIFIGFYVSVEKEPNFKATNVNYDLDRLLAQSREPA